jgi:hypothetical protein
MLLTYWPTGLLDALLAMPAAVSSNVMPA